MLAAPLRPTIRSSCSNKLVCCSNAYAFLRVNAKSSTKLVLLKRRSEKGASAEKNAHASLPYDPLPCRCTLLAAKIAELEAQLRKSLADLKLAQVVHFSLHRVQLQLLRE